jgi:Xaa-Pro dipeptidase
VRGSPYINHSVLEKYESVGGVRIEDVLLITENGSENLSPARKDVEFLEKVCSGVSV